MDGIIMLLVVISVVSSIYKTVTKQIKKTQEAGGRQSSAPRSGKVTPADLFPDVFPSLQPETPVKTAPAPKAPAKPVPTPEEQKPFREISTQVAPRIGVEGEDDCHEYMLEDAFSTLDSMPSDDEPSEEFSLAFHRTALLQGVIMSEILTRPAVRARVRRV